MTNSKVDLLKLMEDISLEYGLSIVRNEGVYVRRNFEYIASLMLLGEGLYAKNIIENKKDKWALLTEVITRHVYFSKTTDVYEVFQVSNPELFFQKSNLASHVEYFDDEYAAHLRLGFQFGLYKFKNFVCRYPYHLRDCSFFTKGYINHLNTKMDEETRLKVMFGGYSEYERNSIYTKLDYEYRCSLHEKIINGPVLKELTDRWIELLNKLFIQGKDEADTTNKI